MNEDRCTDCGGLHVPLASELLALVRDEQVPVVCTCECCAKTVRVVAEMIDEIADEQAEFIRARIAGFADRLREGVVLRTVDIPRPVRTELLAAAVSN